jgi:hypothetical protein
MSNPGRKPEKPPCTNRGVTARLPGETSKTTSRLRSAGIDWLTCTSDKDSVGLAWFEIFNALAGEPKDWANPWYSGKADDHLRWGYNPKIGYVLIVSGEMSEVVWARTVPIERKVTRIDVQVTVELQEPNLKLAKDGYSDNATSNFRKYGLIQNSRNGQTLYVGSRTSAQFGRLYDKGVESTLADPGKLWRYEVELKKPVANSVAKQLASWCDSNSGELHYAIVPFVFDWFLHRGVGPVFTRDGENNIVVEVGRRVTSDEKKLEWLRTQIRPTVQYLLGRGKADLLSEALGCRVEQLSMLDK